MVLAEVAEQEAITVTNEEIAERTQLYKVQYQQNAEQFDQPEMQREVASRLLTEKTVDRLVEIAIKK